MPEPQLRRFDVTPSTSGGSGPCAAGAGSSLGARALAMEKMAAPLRVGSRTLESKPTRRVGDYPIVVVMFFKAERLSRIPFLSVALPILLPWPIKTLE